MSTDSERIEAVLRRLIGQPFWGYGRSASLLIFQFGQRKLRVRSARESYKVTLDVDWA